jgi:hypothetical protein
METQMIQLHYDIVITHIPAHFAPKKYLHYLLTTNLVLPCSIEDIMNLNFPLITFNESSAQHPE